MSGVGLDGWEGVEGLRGGDLDLWERVWGGARVGVEDALRLYGFPLGVLGLLADRRRVLAKGGCFGGRGGDVVSYVVDRNVNYTNVCDVYCKFCAFYRRLGDGDSYVISREVLEGKVQELVDLGGTQVLLQGGHHPELGLDWYLEMLGFLRGRFPSVNVHGFSPSELSHFRRLFGLSFEDLLVRLREAGLGSIPGGGGEILVDRVRRRVSPLKVMSDEWLEVMGVAHGLGLSSSATMMFGHVESVGERVEHLERVRRQQDESGGFTAFIGWSYQASERRGLRGVSMVGACEYLRMQALSRIFLDNIENVQSSWVTQGLEVGQLGLGFGANDLGGVMMEENVVSEAGTTFRMSVGDMRRLIGDAGFEAVQRDSWYREVAV